MRHIRNYIIGSLALPLLLLSCTDNGLTLGVRNGGSANGGLVRMELNISTPEAFSTRNNTRAITEDNDTTLDGRFTVFGFTYETNETTQTTDTILQFVLKTSGKDHTGDYVIGDRNTESNLNGNNTYADSYGDYTESPSIAWHPADANYPTSGRLYIEYWETKEPVYLLVLANVDSTAIAALLTGDTTTPATITIGESSFEKVTEALAPALDFDVYDETINSIPMAAECELEDGITLGSTGSISLRRSVAKFTIRVEYTKERFPYKDYIPFSPDSVQIVNLNATYATVYAPSSETPNISTKNYKEDGTTEDYSPVLYFHDPNDVSDTRTWLEGTNNDGDSVWYQEIVMYVAETENSRVPAYTRDGSVDGTPIPNTGANPARISVLVGGTFNDNDGELLGRNWYRLDLIPETATSDTMELTCILRNHHYRFVVDDALNRGSSSEVEALELDVPDNFPFGGGEESAYVVVTDEDILSITVEYYHSSTSDVPYYVGVSSTSIELDVAQDTDACARVKMITNFSGWNIDQYSIPYATDGSGNRIINDTDGSYARAISFVWDSNSQTLWLWLDYPDDVEVGETYAYYIVAGNIRKKMRITIVDSSATDTGRADTGEPN